jgi:hypothetical protein
MTRDNLDPIRDYYEWVRRQRRRRIMWALATWFLLLLSAVAVIAIIAGMVIWALVTF